MSKAKHYHIWAESMDGNEFINTVVENQYDCAYYYLQIMQNIFHRTMAHQLISVEDIAVGLDDEKHGVLVWSNTIFLKAGGCLGGCFSPSWN